jgi:hypothetical protein
MDIKEVEFDDELYKKNLEDNDFSSREDEELSSEDIEQVKADLEASKEINKEDDTDGTN